MRGGWGHPQGDKQMAAAGLTVEKPSLPLGRPIFYLLCTCTNGRNATPTM